MNIQTYHAEWFEKEFPTHTKDIPNIQRENQGLVGYLRQISGFRYLKGILGNKFKHIIKSLLQSRVIFGYPVSIFEKEVAISYVKYIYQNNPELSENVFGPETLDEVRAILNNQFHFAYTTFVPLEKLYPGDALAEFKKAETFHRKALKRNGNIYEYCGFKSLLPDFEYSVLVKECGISYLPLEVKAKIRGTTFVDCGAFVGDSAFTLQKLDPVEILAMEPDPKNFEILKAGIKLNAMTKVTPLNYGVGDKKGTAKFIPEGICGRVSDNGVTEINITTINDLKNEKKRKIGLIKMDIEGYEMHALRGAEATIRTDTPALIIAIYHSGSDFFEIPKYIHSINPNYRMKIVSLSPLIPLYEKYLIAY